MTTNITPEDLSDEIMKCLEEGGREVKAAVNDVIAEAGAEGVRILKKGGPYRERSGKYTKAWKQEQTNKLVKANGLNQHVIYSGNKQYRLTHLLEKGHQNRGGGRTRPYEHIAPAQEEISKIVDQKIAQKLGG